MERMTISRLIQNLKTVQKDHGDLFVSVLEHDTENGTFEETPVHGIALRESEGGAIAEVCIVNEADFDMLS